LPTGALQCEICDQCLGFLGQRGFGRLLTPYNLKAAKECNA